MFKDNKDNKKFRRGDLVKWSNGYGYGLVVEEKRDKRRILDMVLIYWFKHNSTSWLNEDILYENTRERK